MERWWDSSWERSTWVNTVFLRIGEQLLNEFIDHLRKLGVKKINTHVDWNDSKLIHFFSANRFSPSKTINLERSL
jgi:hypothetical protein